MTSPDPSIPLIRVLAGLHVCAGVAAALYGGFIAAYDVLDGDTGDWDGFGLAIGAIIVVLALAPLLVLVPATVSRRLGVVRGCGVVSGVVALLFLCFVEYVEPVFVLPALLLGAVSLGSAVVAASRQADPVSPDPRGERVS